VQAAREAVDATPAAHPERAAYLSNFAKALLLAAERTGDRAALGEAVEAARAAVRATPQGDPGRAAYLSNLSNGLLLEAERTGNGALDEAVRAAREAVDTTPNDYPGRADLLVALGTALARRYESTRNTADLDDAIAQLQRAAVMPTATPATRLWAAEQWATRAFDAGNVSSALDGYIAAMGLLNDITWGWSGRSGSDEELRRRADLVSDATACAVTAGRPALAIEILEQARSLAWNQTLGLQPELTRLSQRAPDLARRLTRLRTTLSKQLHQPSPFAQVPGEGRWIQRETPDEPILAAREWRALLEQIRAMDGFTDFLRPVAYEKLALVTKHGPVVLLNASRYGCHALVMNTSSINVVDLSDLTLNAVLEQAGRLVGVLVGTSVHLEAESRYRARATMLDILQWTWDKIVGPVLDALGLEKFSESIISKPHIIWCPTGPLTALPIHAAGRYARDVSNAVAGESVLDRVVCSYTSTLSALLRTDGIESSAPAVHRELVVALPNTPGYPALPAAIAELAALERLRSTSGTDKLVGAEATRISVLEALRNHSWIHMACHATQHPSDPSRSAFVMWDGTLTVADVATLDLAQPELAFLSSCQTATTNVRLTDEPMQIGGLMQFLGYRNVITTTWEVPDVVAPRVAEIVYARLAEGEGSFAHEPGNVAGRVARALHDAVQQIRLSYPADPLLWASYVHFGG